ncbi:DUF2190 family protein [Shinella zoogloeoides]|uniref:DUF2190 family protein n=1 Tax=Shinella zoogloeoides TaxID=352475 RepID=UPI001F597EE4|nr:DUF2190 family protein [Shinella zoogloeoides]
MKNFIQPGSAIDSIAPSGGVVSGRPVIIGSLIGISSVTADEGKPFVLQREGVYRLPKVSAQAWTQGAKIYWTSSNQATTTSSGNTLIGIAAAAADNPSDFGDVLLGPTTV